MLNIIKVIKTAYYLNQEKIKYLRQHLTANKAHLSATKEYLLQTMQALDIETIPSSF